MPKHYKAATLHEPSFAPGIGEIKKEIQTNTDGAHKAVESITLEEGSNIVTVVIKDQVGKPVVIDIPLTNFKTLRA